MWSNKGQLLYEKKLSSPVSNWNIHEDVLVFQEHIHSEVLNVVRLFEDKQAEVIEVKTPRGLIASRVSTLINSRY